MAMKNLLWLSVGLVTGVCLLGGYLLLPEVRKGL